jgi:hypothetical protein
VKREACNVVLSGEGADELLAVTIFTVTQDLEIFNKIPGGKILLKLRT